MIINNNYPSFQHDTKDSFNEIKSFTLFKNNKGSSSKITPNNGSHTTSSYSSHPVGSNQNILTSADVAKKHKLITLLIRMVR